jgi:hypothetical protein
LLYHTPYRNKRYGKEENPNPELAEMLNFMIKGIYINLRYLILLLLSRLCGFAQW